MELQNPGFCLSASTCRGGFASPPTEPLTVYCKGTTKKSWGLQRQNKTTRTFVGRSLVACNVTLYSEMSVPWLGWETAHQLIIHQLILSHGDVTKHF